MILLWNAFWIQISKERDWGKKDRFDEEKVKNVQLFSIFWLKKTFLVHCTGQSEVGCCCSYSNDTFNKKDTEHVISSYYWVIPLCFVKEIPFSMRVATACRLWHSPENNLQLMSKRWKEIMPISWNSLTSKSHPALTTTGCEQKIKFKVQTERYKK